MINRPGCLCVYLCISCVVAFRCGVRGWVCVCSWWFQRFFACADGRLLRPNDGPLDEREQHARPPINAGGCCAQRAPVRCGGLWWQHRYKCVAVFQITVISEAIFKTLNPYRLLICVTTVNDKICDCSWCFWCMLCVCLQVCRQSRRTMRRQTSGSTCYPWVPDEAVWEWVLSMVNTVPSSVLQSDKITETPSTPYNSLQFFAKRTCCFYFETIRGVEAIVCRDGDRLETLDTVIIIINNK